MIDERRIILKQLLAGTILPGEAIPLLRKGYHEIMLVWVQDDQTFKVDETGNSYASEDEVKAAIFPKLPFRVKIHPCDIPLANSEKDIVM